MSRILAAGAIARGSIFTIFGIGIGPTVGVGVTSFPLGTELGGVRIRVFTLDAEVEAIPVFVRADQINAIMPSDAPLGYVALEVIFEGQPSNVAPVQVVDAAVSVFTSTGTGAGPASVTNFVSQTDQPPNSRAVPASPSQFVTLWITGLGAVTGGDNMRPIGHCHVNRVEPQRPAWIPFQAAALAVSHTLNASFRNRLNMSLLHK